jgi:5-formyltetrahydrofolate cyclo-ligase
MDDSNSPDDRSQSDIRTTCKFARAQLTPVERLRLSETIANKIIASDFFLDAQNVAIFIPMKTEVDIWPVIKCAWRLKKRVFAPIAQESMTLSFHEFVDENDLSTNKMGIGEPIGGELVPPDELDLVLMPLVAFDIHQNRIGMGGGFYDRTFSFLQQLSRPSRPKLIGVAFECQRVERITPNPWDIRLLSVFTEND